MISTDRATSTGPDREPELAAEDAALPGSILALTGDLEAQDHLMEMALERGYGLCCRSAGSEALRILAAEPPQVLVVDMDAPGARDLLRTIRAHAKWRDIPLLALTATNNPMIAVTVDAPIFFMPEMTGLEQALAARLDPAAAPPERVPVVQPAAPLVVPSRPSSSSS
jgi:CheY-like chemotaxis protein